MRTLIVNLALTCLLGGVCHAQYRTWTSTKETSVWALMVSSEDGEVVLGIKDGGIIKVALSKLSREDRYFVANELEKQADAEASYKAGLEATSTSDAVAQSHFARGVKSEHSGCLNRLGLQLIREQKYKEAQEHFLKAVRSQEHRQKYLEPDGRYSYVSALNNLTLTQFRNGQFDAAIKNLRLVVAVMNEVPGEVIHNSNIVGVLLGDVSPRFAAKITKLLGELPPPDVTFTRETGWIYMYETRIDRVKDKGTKTEEIMPLLPEHVGSLTYYGSGSGFVISEGYVLTNAHVVEIDRGFDAHALHMRTDLDVFVIQLELAEVERRKWPFLFAITETCAMIGRIKLGSYD